MAQKKIVSSPSGCERKQQYAKRTSYFGKIPISSLRKFDEKLSIQSCLSWLVFLPGNAEQAWNDFLSLLEAVNRLLCKLLWLTSFEERGQNLAKIVIMCETGCPCSHLGWFDEDSSPCTVHGRPPIVTNGNCALDRYIQWSRAWKKKEDYFHFNLKSGKASVSYRGRHYGLALFWLCVHQALVTFYYISQLTY